MDGGDEGGVVEVEGGVMDGGRIQSVAKNDIGAVGHGFQHEGEVFAAHEGFEAVVDLVFAQGGAGGLVADLYIFPF